MGLARLLSIGLVFLAAPAFGQAQGEQPDAVRIDVAYTGELLSALSGGSTRAPRYLDNLDVIGAFDLDALSGISRTTAQIYVLSNNGRRFSDEVTGDMLALSNIETGVPALRLYEAWIEHSGDGGHWSLRAGLYDLNSEFDALESSALFAGSAHGIGPDISQSGANGPSIFPSTSLGVRGEIRLADGVKFRAAVLDGVPNDPNRPRRTVIRLNGREGALGIAELDLKAGAARVLLGGWAYTSKFDDIRDDGLAEPRRRRSAGAYIRSEALLHDRGNAELRGFVRFGVATAEANPFAAFASAGLNAKGMIPGRPHDETGLSIARAWGGSPFRSALNVLGARAARGETAFELTHRFVIADRWSIQPQMHYIVTPGLDRDRRDVLAVGLRGVFGFTF